MCQISSRRDRKFFLQMNYTECWDLVAKIDHPVLSREAKGGYPSVGSKTREPIRCGWIKMPEGRQIFEKVFRVEKGFLPIDSSFNDQVTVDILPEKSTLTATYHVKAVISIVVRSVREKRSTVGTRNIPLLHDNASTHKAKFIVACLDEQYFHPHTIQSRLCTLRLLIFLDIEAETGRAEVLTRKGPVKTGDFRAHGLVPVQVPECS